MRNRYQSYDSDTRKVDLSPIKATNICTVQEANITMILNLDSNTTPVRLIKTMSSSNNFTRDFIEHVYSASSNQTSFIDLILTLLPWLQHQYSHNKWFKLRAAKHTRLILRKISFPEELSFRSVFDPVLNTDMTQARIIQLETELGKKHQEIVSIKADNDARLQVLESRLTAVMDMKRILAEMPLKVILMMQLQIRQNCWINQK